MSAVTMSTTPSKALHSSSSKNSKANKVKSPSVKSPKSPNAINASANQAQGGLSIDPTEILIRKRLPPSLPRRDCDVYITNKTCFPAQLSRCQKLLDSGHYPSIYLHSLGAAIPLASNLALRLQKDNGGQESVSIESHTSTVELTDDFEHVGRGNSGDQQHHGSRNNSALHIKISLKTAASPTTSPST